MKVTNHTINNRSIAVVHSNSYIISDISSATELLGKLYYEGYEAIIIEQENITPHFFHLKNGMAGEILQKFSNFKMQLLIVGDLSTKSSESLNNFIFESNKGTLINFIKTHEKAITIVTERFK